MRHARFTTVIASLLLLSVLGGCKTVPDELDRTEFLARVDSTTEWFKGEVTGLDSQIADSAGYIIFPDIAQWGMLITGGTWGRGALMTPEGEQIGWSAINELSAGLQAGVRGLRMLLVLENEVVLNKFKANKWTGSAAAVAVVGEAGGSGQAPFSNGVAAYEAASSGLMAGVNVGLEYVRYVPLGAEDE